MSKTIRQAKRERHKAKRKAARKQSNKNKAGRKAGSIAIHSRLPGLEGTEMGAMEVIVDKRRKQTHPAEISITVHDESQKRTILWSIETGFGGLIPRFGYQVFSDTTDSIPSMTWVCELPYADQPECLEKTETPEGEQEGVST